MSNLNPIGRAPLTDIPAHLRRAMRGKGRRLALGPRRQVAGSIRSGKGGGEVNKPTSFGHRTGPEPLLSRPQFRLQGQNLNA